MDSKSLARIEVKDEVKGEVEAVFATLGVVDKDDDITEKGAFTEGAQVVISAYGHKSWEGAPPVGMGTIHEVGDEVVMKGHFFMDTTAGREHFAVVKALGPKQEWSYGFNVDDSEDTTHEGKSVRKLKKMTVHEVSPVMRGAGVRTRTTYAKSFNDEISDAVDAVSAAVESAERVVALRAEKGKELSQVNRKSLDGLAAACDKLKSLLTEKDDNTSDNEDIMKMYLANVASNLEG